MSAPALTRVDLWGPARARRALGGVDLVWLAVGFVGAQLVTIPVAFWIAARFASGDVAAVSVHPGFLVACQLTLWGFLAGYPVLASHRYATGSVRVDFGLSLNGARSWWSVIWRAAMIALGLRAVSLAIGAGLSAAGLASGENTSWLMSGFPTGVLVFFLVGTAVIAPIVEELAYRGLALRAALRAWGSSRAGRAGAFAVTSAMFGLSHLGSLDASGLSTVVQTGLLGLALAHMSVRKGGLVAAMTAHVVFNSSGVIVLVLSGGM